jgi:hypothetical protein
MFHDPHRAENHHMSMGRSVLPLYDIRFSRMKPKYDPFVNIIGRQQAGGIYMKTTQAELPEQLYKKVQSLVKEGLFRDEEVILKEATRRFLETHESELMEKFIREDVEWGLHGEE